MMDKDIIKDAREYFDYSTSKNFENVQDALKSSRFVDGYQWPEELIREREKENRPCLTNNKLRKFVYQVFGEIQQNHPDIHIVPTNSTSNPIFANIRDKLIKHIELRSDAVDAYDSAVLQALEGGYGAWRIITEYADDDSFDQEIKIVKIPNRFSVVMDADAQGKVFDDSKYGFVTTLMSKKELKKLYGKDTVTDFDAPVGDTYSGWISEDNVRIAEYFYKDYEEKKLLLLSNGQTIPSKELNALKELYPDIGSEVVKERKVRKEIIKWCKLSYEEILEPVTTFPGKYIPIVMCVGYEHNDEGLRRFRALVHDALDPSMMRNYWKTHATELVALAPKTPWVVTPQQVKNFEKIWQKVNLKPTPVLYYNHVEGVKKPSREAASHIPSATINEINMADSEIQDVIGMYAPSIGEPSNERSGRAIIARQAQANNTIFTFINNFQRALFHTSRILLDVMPSTYTPDRILKILGRSGLEELNSNFDNLSIDQTKAIIGKDMEVGKYDVTPTIGPTFATKRQQTAASMLDFLQFVPQAAPIIGPRLANIMDWEGSTTLANELQQLFTGQPQSPADTNSPTADTRIGEMQNKPA